MLKLQYGILSVLLYCRELNELNPIGSEAVGWPSASHLRGFRTISLCPKVPMPLLSFYVGWGTNGLRLNTASGVMRLKLKEFRV